MAWRCGLSPFDSSCATTISSRLTGCFVHRSKVYKGEHQPVKYFALRNPYSRTKTMKFASQNPSIVAALHNHVMRFATKG